MEIFQENKQQVFGDREEGTGLFQAGRETTF